LEVSKKQIPQAREPFPAAIQAKFERGFLLHRQGKLVEAEQLYVEVVQLNPTHFDALHFLGVIALQTGRTQRSVDLITKAIGLKPGHAEAYNNRGNGFFELKRMQDALASYDKAIALKPDYADAYNNRGNGFFELKRMQDALASYDKAIALKPGYSEAYNNRGNALKDLKRLDEALASYDKAIALKPDYAEAYNNRGNALCELKRLEDALVSYDKAIALKSGQAEAYNNRGYALFELKRLDDALANYERAIGLKPDYAEAYNNRGNALFELKRLDDALANYERAIALKPDYAEAYTNRGNALFELKRLDDALANYERAIALKPDYAEAYNNRGNALFEMKRLDDALASYDKAIAHKPEYAEAYSNRGNALFELNRLEEALASYDKAIALKPDYAEAYGNRGNALFELQRLEDALASYDKAIALKPDYAEAYGNRGNALSEMKRLDDALASYDKAIALKPDYADAYNNRGNAFFKLKRLEDALASYDKAIALKPDYEFLFGMILHIKMKVSDFPNVESQFAQVSEEILRGAKVSVPFPILAISSSLEVQRKAAEIWVSNRHPVRAALPPLIKRARHGKIRLGYFSAGFRNDPTSYLIADLIEKHDRSNFEIIAFSFGPDQKDKMRSRMEAAFDQFIDVRNQPCRYSTILSRNMEIDIAIDLGGFTAFSRSDIFALRAAPIQVSYLGYPGTMGADFIDYIIADRIVIPEDSKRHYCEKIVYLPNSYQVNDTKRSISDKTFTRAELGLPPMGFVFCCFNNNYKITPRIFDRWMRILKQVKGSVLWLFEGNEKAAGNLRKEALARGVNAERLIFAKRLPLDEHLARHCSADLFLDTLPYNAHTTASDALWAGLPVLTCLGETFAGRVAASLLNAIHLPELITTTPEAYETLAIELAANADRLAEIKHKLAKNRLTTPLFDTNLFTKHIEAAYAAMYERYHADLAPSHIYVPRS
jgi:protein O-GlcNAc transferase